VSPDNGYNGALRITRTDASGKYINRVRSGQYGWSIGTVYDSDSFGIGTIAATDSSFSPSFVINTSGDVGIGGGPGGSYLEVHGAANVHGIYGQPSTAGYWGIEGVSQDGTTYGGLGVANMYGVEGVGGANIGVYGVSTSNVGVYGSSTSSIGVEGVSTSNWAGEFVGTNYGVYASGATWAIQANGSVYIDNASSSAELCLNGNCTKHSRPVAISGAVCFPGNVTLAPVPVILAIMSIFILGLAAARPALRNNL
jgi:hypothetical protein